MSNDSLLPSSSSSPSLPSMLPLLAGRDLDAPLAWCAGEPVTGHTYLKDVDWLAAAGHLAYLLVLGGLGAALAVRRLQRRLIA